MELRQALTEDVPACLEVFYDALDELHRRMGQPPMPRNPETTKVAMRHIVETDPDGCWLAEDGGRMIGFGLAHRRADHWYLAFLFVAPGAQTRGVGRNLLERCLGSTDSETGAAAARRSVVVEAIQPVSTGLYAQYEMVPRAPLYVFTGEVRPGALADPDVVLRDAGLTLQEFTGSRHAAQSILDTLDRTVVGWQRPSEHEFLATADRRAFLYQRNGATVGYGYVQRSGRLGPVCVVDAADLLPLTTHLLGSMRPPGAWQVIVPGPAAGVFAPLLRAGLRIDGPPAVFCSSWSGPSFERYLPMNFAYG